MLQTVDYSRIFADATVDVLATFMDEPAVAGPLQEVRGSVPLLEVAVLLGITGNMQGRLLLEFSKECALAVCEAMNFGEPFEDFDDMAIATLCELANLAGGRAITILNDGGGEFSIAPPTILYGTGMRASGVTSIISVVPVETSVGTIIVNVSVAKKA